MKKEKRIPYPIRATPNELDILRSFKAGKKPLIECIIEALQEKYNIDLVQENYDLKSENENLRDMLNLYKRQNSQFANKLKRLKK